MNSGYIISLQIVRGGKPAHKAFQAIDYPLHVLRGNVLEQTLDVLIHL